MSIHVLQSCQPEKINTKPGVNGAHLTGIGWALPSQIVTNEMVKKIMCVPPKVEAEHPTTTKWIEDHMGVKQRRYLSPGETNIEFAVLASRRAMESASVKPEQIDRIFVATVTPESHWPTDAALIAGELGIKAAGCDITAACSSYLNTLEAAYAYLRAGMAKRVLVVGMDAMTAAANPFDRNSFPLFGDAATALVLEAFPNDDCFWYWKNLQLPEYADLISSQFISEARDSEKFPYAVARGLRRVTMDGPKVFKQALRLAKIHIELALEKTGLTAADFGAVCFHQANARITEAVCRQLEFAEWQVIKNIDRFGNTTSASVPLCLAEAWGQILHHPSAHQLESGEKVLLVTFGAGFTIGVCILEWSQHCLEPQNVTWAQEAVEDMFRLAL